MTPIECSKSKAASFRQGYLFVGKMFVPGDGFGNALLFHEFEGNTIRQAEAAQVCLPTSSGTKGMQVGINRFHLAQWQQHIQKTIEGLPAKFVLNYGPGFV